ncbi:O-antigen ligase family protein [Halomonas llamarensis]|uniref:O-antigen ligase family protein n=1 Tax=Halomonas llamarensis TaxID=2945104 RepID=A0ABT0SU82_9GAMM|nr:O-antigen ligase family protein [Halomonas llamarensis]MCL7931405.1 O-antigen ligase family protein [Halomonas llamarensis]
MQASHQSISHNLQEWQRYISEISIFLLGSLVLILPSGYSIGPTILFLSSFYLIIKRPYLSINNNDWAIIAALAGYALTIVIINIWHNEPSASYDKPLRFLLAIPVLLWLLVYPPRLSWVWSGIIIGSLGTGAFALYQKGFLSIDRAHGHTQAIQYGNLSLLLGMFCLAGLGWASQRTHRHLWIALILMGALGGFLASLLSGSRGGWVGLPLMLLVLYRAYGDFFTTRKKIIGSTLLLVIVILLYQIPQTGVQSRAEQAFEDIHLYTSGEKTTTSVGFRFDMWKGALQLAYQKPFLGWGENEYQPGMQQVASEGLIHPLAASFGHAHNQFLDTLAKNGVVGLAALLLLYFLPLGHFSKYLKSKKMSQRSIATSGALLSVSYIDFSLTQGFLNHNSGVMMYAFWVVIWAALLRRNNSFTT